MTQDRIAALEARIAALEAPDPCYEGHNFQQAIDKFTGLLFCAKCGATQRGNLENPTCH